MPTSYDADEQDRIEKNEKKRNTFFKIIEPFLWLIVIIIVVALVMMCMILTGGYFS